MAHPEINRAIVLSIQSSAVPRVDGETLFDAYGDDLGERLSSQVSELVKEAASMPIEWGGMSLAEGVRDIMVRFGERHPELSVEALDEIGRCVGW